MPETRNDGPNEARPRSRKRRVRRLVALCAVAIPLLVVGIGVLQQGGPYDAARPPADGEPGRWVWLEGAKNTRDVGGYPTRDGRTVRRGRVYRSGSLSHVTDAGCESFRELGIVTVVDFRNRLTALPLYGGDVLGIHRAAKVYGFPVSFAAQEDWQDYYVCGLRDNADAFRRTFALLAEPDRLPLMYHCRQGADRTGVMTALLLTLLGVDRDSAIADFRLSEQVGPPGSLGAIERLLDKIEARGGIEPFLADLGVSSAEQTRIRENLLTP